MEGHLQGDCGDIVILHVKTEAVDENTSALVLSSRGSPAPCGDSACRGGEQTAEEPGENTAAPGLLYPVSTDRFFTTSGDGKTYLKIAPGESISVRGSLPGAHLANRQGRQLLGATDQKGPPKEASAMPPSPSEKTLLSGSDFSSKAVLCLIEAVGRRWGLYETRERSQLFQSVQEEMASKGHLLPVEKIRRKWNNLIVTYKRVKDRSQETGHAKTSWEFFDADHLKAGNYRGGLKWAKILRIHKVRCDCKLCKPGSKDLDDEKNDDECFICKTEEEEDEFVMCDTCPRSFHKKCHLPHVEDNIIG
ncbi:uncharacterized protein [Notothenia coriiceps]|uniref:Uncharacterized protein n=1 Tax=Notothenia coriiceps TaxID=8208 RepID=A0A6I9PCR8_9TELE|nr:PREDICTED: uncharacterized protein LOC104957822 [Notothenia coriiceps]